MRLKKINSSHEPTQKSHCLFPLLSSIIAKEKEIDIMLKSYIAFDVETTGLNPLENEIIEIGALKVRDGKVAERFMEFIRPTVSISPAITSLTGITNEMVSDARPRCQVVSDFLDFCEEDVLIGHNVSFDYSFMKCIS